jgi:hypothetical protein
MNSWALVFLKVLLLAQNTGIKFHHTSAKSQDCRNGDPASSTETLSSACFLQKIKITDVPASSAYLNSKRNQQYPKAKHSTIITISSTTRRGPWPPQKNSTERHKFIL